MKNLTEKSSEYIVSYIDSIRLDKIARKRPEKLHCRPGYVQRGAVCQKIGNAKTQKPTAVRSRRAGGGLAKLAVGAIAAGAAGALAIKAATSKNQSSKPSNLPEVPQEKLDQVIKHPASKPYLKAAAIAGVSTATIATAIAVSHPRTRQELIDPADLDDQLIRKVSQGALNYQDLTKAQKRGSATIKEVMQKAVPENTPSGNYQVDTNLDNIAAELKERHEKNKAEIDKLPEGHKKRAKLEAQQTFLDIFLKVHENKDKKAYNPSVVFMGFRDEKGNLVGINACAPSYKHKALWFSGFAVFEGAPTTAAKDIMATNQEISRRLGMRGRMVGEPLEQAIPLYKRYGAKPIPLSGGKWIFEGDDKKVAQKKKGKS